MTSTIGRRVLGAGVAIVLGVGSAIIGWRVLAPAELSAPAEDAYPVAAVRAPGVTGRTPTAPLIVDGRIRVYAAARQVRADAPIDAKYYGTPRWSFRRWPEQVNGVVAIGTTVVSRWSDGELVALDAVTGKVTWRVDGPPAAGGHDGRRTGASTVWAPSGLHTSGSTVLVAGGGRLAAIDAGTGTRRWQAELPPGCDEGFTTLGGQYACATGAYDVATGTPVTPWPPGPAGSLGCDVARSACGGLRDATGKGWLTTGTAPRRAPALDPLSSTVASGLALTPEPPTLIGVVAVADRGSSPEATVIGDRIVARDPLTGAEVWRWTAPAGDQVQVLAAQGGLVHLLTGTRGLFEGRELVTVGVATGVERSRFRYAWQQERTTWAAGLVQASAGFVATERLRTPADPDAADPEYYFTVDTVIIAAT